MRTLIIGSSDKNVKLWHMKSGQCVRTIEHKGKIPTYHKINT